MMGFLRSVLRAHVEPITHENVRPADRDKDMEAEIDAAQTSTYLAIKRAERRSWEIRQELTGNVLRLVAGD
ncbi:hypothetical protein EDF70_10556 [Neorhizobium sp. JUb45]|nr:hypothetical protein EDF70_10556 [Neorhizobium sp. JUb45]